MKHIYPILLVFLLACNPQEGQERKVKGETMGTWYRVSWLPSLDDVKKTNLQAEVDSVLIAFNESVSTYIPTSTISNVNGTDTLIPVDEYFARVFTKANEVSENTDGAFDVTVMPLVNAWGFGPADTIPKARATIDSLLHLVGYRKLSLRETDGKYFVHKTDSRVQADFSAIAKGYGVDLICGLLEEKGIKNYLVEIGGEVRTKGGNDKGEPWKIGIDKPIDDPAGIKRELKAVLKLQNKAVATSGNYRNYYYRNGKKVSHEIDPKTGYPAGNNLLSAVVIAEDCMTADAYATAFMVMGLEKSLAYLVQDTSLGAYLIYAGGDGKMQTATTENIRNMLSEEE